MFRGKALWSSLYEYSTFAGHTERRIDWISPQELGKGTNSAMAAILQTIHDRGEAGPLHSETEVAKNVVAIAYAGRVGSTFPLFLLTQMSF